MHPENELPRDRPTDELDDCRGLGQGLVGEGEPTIRERLVEASQMGQEPKDRMWAVIFVVSILVFALGGIMVETRMYLSEGRSLSFQRGAVDCLTVILDDDRDFDLPNYCRDPSLVVYYPVSSCDKYFPDIPSCGAEEGS